MTNSWASSQKKKKYIYIKKYVIRTVVPDKKGVKTSRIVPDFERRCVIEGEDFFLPKKQIYNLAYRQS